MSDVLCSRRQKQVIRSSLRYQDTRLSSESLDLDGVIFEILSRLPAKSLLRFRCVCKAWRALISDPYFIRKHLSCINTKIKTSYCFLLRKGRPNKNSFRAVEYEAILKCLRHDGPVPSRKLDFPAFDPLFIFCGSCNGLICLALTTVEPFTFMLCNPCTRESHVLPQSPRRWEPKRFMGFGYDSTTDDYKAILGSCKYGHEFVVIFTLKTGLWREVKWLSKYKYYEVRLVGCLVNEAVHWVLHEVEYGTRVTSKIVSFDLKEEKFHEILFPYSPSTEEIAKVGINCKS